MPCDVIEVDERAGVAEGKILALAFGEPRDDRQAGFFGRLRDGFELVGVGEIKMPDSLAACLYS